MDVDGLVQRAVKLSEILDDPNFPEEGIPLTNLVEELDEDMERWLWLLSVEPSE